MKQQIRLAVFALLTCAAFAQNTPTPLGETAVHTQFVEVQPGVKLEVLDWGGTGRNLVLLAGLGCTAHVFDSLGPKLAQHDHVIGITRRGFGKSSVPQTGYDAKQLGGDVVAVLDALHIADPVLVGHSIAGEELSAVSTYHPGRAAALVYLDAAGTFAFYNPKHGDYVPALAQLRDDLAALQDDLFDDGIISKTLIDMALFQANLAELRAEVEGATGPAPQASDLASISAYQAYMKGYYGGIIPESEVRQMHRVGEDGKVGEFLGIGRVAQSIMLGEERFHSIDTPLLAIFSYPSLPYPSQTTDPEKLAAYRASGTSRIAAQMAIVREQPHAKVVAIPNGTHFIFLSNEEEVISQINDFVKSLPAKH
ncbi:MAG TPA: alpha/beta hydrolase [Candidatus Sulfotelmatobacter sp.]|nr:alpha/beta hydrolase [Candidatus Sulfotelmatobacter sp.]